MASFRIQLNQSQIDAIVGGQLHESVSRAANVSRDRVKQNMRRSGRRDTGAMYNGVTATGPSGPRMNPRARVNSGPDYTTYQEFGTRAHGPVRAQFLRFQPKGSSSFVFAKWVRGVTPGNFFKDALAAVTPGDFL